MNRRLKNMSRKYIPGVAGRLLWIISRLARTRIVGFDQAQRFGQVNFAHWHADTLAFFPWFGDKNIAVLISQSRDGEMLAQAAHRMGYHVVRGSSSRGGAGGMLALIKASREGFHGVVTVDGPQGPRHVCKPGIVRLSQKSGVPLLPAGIAVSRKISFNNAWDKTFLPLPFCRQVLFFGQPLYFGPEKDDAALAAYCRQVEQALHQAHAEAVKILNQWTTL